MTYNNLKSTPYSAKSYKTLIGLIIQSKKTIYAKPAAVAIAYIVY